MENPMKLDVKLDGHGILSLIITYQKEGPRIDHAKKEAARVGLTPKFAWSIQRDDPRVFELLDSAKNARFRKAPLTRGEIACYWGHRNAWRMLLKSKRRLALVLEDDFFIRDQALLEAVLDTLPQMPAFDVLLLRMFKPRRGVREWRFGLFNVEDRIFGATGATGYLISRDGAQKLLQRMKIFRPVDEDFASPWELGIRVLNTNPEPIAEMASIVSSLDAERGSRRRQKGHKLRWILQKGCWQLRSIISWIMRLG